MIIDSIVDDEEYISKDEYKLYLSSHNTPVAQGLKLNIIDVLRYFAIYNKMKGNEIVFNEIVEDMKNQTIEIQFSQEPILGLFLKRYWRYVNEFKDENINLLKDFRHDFYYFFYNFYQKKSMLITNLIT